MADPRRMRYASDPDTRALEIASNQHGTLSQKQARLCGLSSHQVRYRIGQGRWQVLESGALLICQRATPYSEIAGACVVLNAVASHRSAYRLWGICDQVPDRVEVTVPRSSYRRRSRIEIYSTTQFEMAGVATIHRIPTTGPARTALDLASVLPEPALKLVIERFLDSELATIDGLAHALATHSVRGRPGLAKFRRVLDQCSGLRSKISTDKR